MGNCVPLASVDSDRKSQELDVVENCIFLTKIEQNESNDVNGISHLETEHKATKHLIEDYFDKLAKELLGEAIEEFAKLAPCSCEIKLKTRLPIEEIKTAEESLFKPDPTAVNSKADSYFVDDEFPPTLGSLTYSGQPEFKQYLPKIEWKRPFEINRNATMIKHDMSSADIQQQALGDCWFIATCSALADNPTLLSRVVSCQHIPLSGSEYIGGPLTFSFHQNGEWVEVKIDDLLPVRDVGYGKYQLVFSKSTQPSEMWVSLLEKAYAKLKGSYEALVGGNATSAWSDLTGGMTEVLLLEDEDSSKVWKRLRDVTTNHTSFATASCGKLVDGEGPLPEDSIGLVESHAYSVVKCVSFGWMEEKVKLIRLRNPWASFEYKGPWSDADHIWKKIEFQEIARFLEFQEKPDGEFFMEFSHFISIFRGVTICTTEPQFTINGKVVNGFEMSIKGEWVEGVNAGGCLNFRESTFPSNPQYHITPQTDDVTSCTISLLQFHPPTPTNKTTFHNCGLYVYELKRPKNSSRKLPLKHFQYNSLHARSKLFTNFQETVIRMDVNTAHSYVIIPCTFYPQKSAQFLLRVFTDGECLIAELN
ncbi:calpain-3-like [Symsagittifera roscoffensis]|uniref:calpain-3-like n=1 Tax=Symsagittifera roscoffensis TaxID=84072 RepID=UPI00307B12A4